MIRTPTWIAISLALVLIVSNYVIQAFDPSFTRAAQRSADQCVAIALFWLNLKVMGEKKS